VQSTPTRGAPARGTTPTSALNQDEAQNDVVMPDCGAAADGWSAGGTVTDSLGRSATYQITVNFTTAQGEELAYATTTVKTSPGRTQAWYVRAMFSPPAVVQCALKTVEAR
jgi:hypothetical protein